MAATDYEAPPHNLEAERALLGALFAAGGDAKTFGRVSSGDFYSRLHCELYHVFRKLHDLGDPIDFVSVSEALRATSDNGDAERLLQILGDIATTAAGSTKTLGYYAGVVRDYADRRRTLAALDQAREAARRGAAEEAQRILADAAAEMAPGSGRRNRFDVAAVHGPDLQRAFVETLKMSHIIEGTWPESSRLIGIYGAPGTYKSFIASDMLCSIAAGIPWHGRPVKQQPVVYIAAEGGAGFLKRVQAWRHHRDCDDLRLFTLVTRPVLVDHEAERHEFVGAVLSMPNPPAIICFDTLARCMIGDENSTADMGKVIIAFDRIAEHTGAKIIFVHHAGKDESRGARGSIALTGATDTLFKTARTRDRQVNLICERQKDKEATRPMGFRMKVVDTGYLDADMSPVSSLVPELDPDAKSPTKRGLKGAARIGMEALLLALEEHGQLASPEVRERMTDVKGDVLFKDRVVHEDQWRAMAYQAGIASSPEKATMRQAFQRMRNKLLDLQLIGTWDGYVWKL